MSLSERLAIPVTDAEVKRFRLLWWLVLGGICSGFITLPFIWRSPASALVVCLGPFLFIIAIVTFGILSSLGRIGLRTAIVAFVGLPLSLAIGLTTDHGARNLIFRFNYPAYKEIARKYVDTPTPEIKERELDPGQLRGFGIYRTRLSWADGSLRIHFLTASGPTLQTATYSKISLKPSAKLEFKLQDELGYWYFSD